MSITVAEVHIWGEFAGAVAWEEDLGVATFLNITQSLKD